MIGLVEFSVSEQRFKLWVIPLLTQGAKNDKRTIGSRGKHGPMAELRDVSVHALWPDMTSCVGEVAPNELEVAVLDLLRCESGGTSVDSVVVESGACESSLLQ